MLATRRSLLLGTAGVLGAALAGCGDDKPKSASGTIEDVTYVTGFNITGQDAFVFVAIEKGWYREVGLNVKVVPGVGTRGNLQHLHEGNAQFAVLDVTGGILDLDKPYGDFMLFAGIYQTTVSCMMALASSGIKAPADLAGKRIGYSEGGVNKTIFPGYARLAGINEATIRWVSLPPPSVRASLLAGQLDAATEIVVNLPTVQAAAKQPVTVLPYSDVIRDLYGNALGASRKLVRENPGQVKRFRDATLKGLAWTIKNPDEAGRIMAAHNPTYKAELAAAEIKQTIPYVSGSAPIVGHLDQARVTRSIALVQSLGLIKSGVAAEQFTAFDLVPA